jgi:uncharacterized protein YqeY
MKLLEKIKIEQLQARKENHEIKKSLLTTLYSEALNVGKNQGNRDSTDDEVISIVKKFIKNTEQNIEIYMKSGKEEAKNIAIQELTILKSYLPQAPSMDDVMVKVEELMNSNSWKKEPSVIGKIMKELKAIYGSSLDGGAISKKLKDWLEK